MADPRGGSLTVRRASGIASKLHSGHQFTAMVPTSTCRKPARRPREILPGASDRSCGPSGAGGRSCAAGALQAAGKISSQRVSHLVLQLLVRNGIVDASKGPNAARVCTGLLEAANWDPADAMTGVPEIRVQRNKTRKDANLRPTVRGAMNTQPAPAPRPPIRLRTALVLGLLSSVLACCQRRATPAPVPLTPPVVAVPPASVHVEEKAVEERPTPDGSARAEEIRRRVFEAFAKETVLHCGFGGEPQGLGRPEEGVFEGDTPDAAEQTAEKEPGADASGLPRDRLHHGVRQQSLRQGRDADQWPGRLQSGGVRESQP